MRPYVGRYARAPRRLRGHHQGRLERDRGGHVIGLRRQVSDDRRYGMLARVTALELGAIAGRVRVWRVCARHSEVPVRRGAVMVVGVIVVDVGVAVLYHRRPRGRQHGHGDHRCEHALHCRQSMGNATLGQISARAGSGHDHYRRARFVPREAAVGLGWPGLRHDPPGGALDEGHRSSILLIT